MRIITLAVVAVMSACCFGAEVTWGTYPRGVESNVVALGPVTNVVTHTVEQSVARQKRIAEWRETWAKMTPEQKEAHRAAQLKRLAEAKRRVKSGEAEVKREQSADGTITITYADGRVVVHRFPKK